MPNRGHNRNRRSNPGESLNNLYGFKCCGTQARDFNVVQEHLCTSFEWQQDGQYWKIANEKLQKRFRSKAGAKVTDIECQLSNASEAMVDDQQKLKQLLDDLNKKGTAAVPDPPQCTEILKEHAASVLEGMLSRLGAAAPSTTISENIDRRRRPLERRREFIVRVVESAESKIDNAVKQFEIEVTEQSNRSPR